MTHATSSGTSSYRDRSVQKGLPSSAFRPLGNTGLFTSVVGFGSYRIEAGVDSHLASLEAALLGGCNLVDTSTNYGDGDSEVAVGRVLSKLFSHGSLTREEVIVVSKAGYLQGENLRQARLRERDGNPIQEVVKFTDSCWHSIHPDFLSEQLTKSLERLGLERLDFLLLHNPEYYLSDTSIRKPRMKIEEVRQVFYDRIDRAFARLEEERKKGRILGYGVSSNQFGSPVTSSEATAVSTMWELAKKHGDGFHLVQLPFNAFESGPFLEKNNGEGGTETALGFAQRVNLGVLANRPLNAFHGNQLVRLADFPANPRLPQFRDQAGRVSELELLYMGEVAPLVDEFAPAARAAEGYFKWADVLSSPETLSLPLDRWEHAEMYSILPQLQHSLGELDRRAAGTAADEMWKNWRQRYVPELLKLLEVIRAQARAQAQKTSDKIAETWARHLPPEIDRESLSRKALALVAHTPGITVVLNGMRSPAYVEDSLGILRFPSFQPSGALFESTRRLKL